MTKSHDLIRQVYDYVVVVGDAPGERSGKIGKVGKVEMRSDDGKV